MIIKNFFDTETFTLTYIVSDKVTKDCVIIDGMETIWFISRVKLLACITDYKGTVSAESGGQQPAGFA